MVIGKWPLEIRKRGLLHFCLLPLAFYLLNCFKTGAQGIAEQWRRLYAATWRSRRRGIADTQRPRTVTVPRHR
jgi:hypothetical protein